MSKLKTAVHDTIGKNGAEIEIADFGSKHMRAAAALALANYKEEREKLPALPASVPLPALDHFANNGLGAAAFGNGKLVGFLGFFVPLANAFGTTRVKGTFSPVHAHGAVFENRTLIYRLLYQAAAEKLVKEGIASHAVGLYAHDERAVSAFFAYGFGLRTMDAVRPMEEINCVVAHGVSFCELDKPGIAKLLGMENLLREHLAASPAFLSYPKQKAEKMDRESRYFAARQNGRLIAYIKVKKEGENFACSDKSMMNICGAFCLPDHRGIGVPQGLLNYLIRGLRKEGYTRLGVDFESFNPTASGFWLKYFSAYTNGVVRRIDERIFERESAG